MPAVSERQRKFMGAELGRIRAGKKTQTGMSEPELEKFASKVKKVKSYMPAGVSLSPKGDIGVARQKEAIRAGGGKLAKGTKIVSAASEFSEARRRGGDTK